MTEEEVLEFSEKTAESFSGVEGEARRSERR